MRTRYAIDVEGRGLLPHRFDNAIQAAIWGILNIPSGIAWAWTVAPLESPAEKVARARALADAGDLPGAARLLRELAIEDRSGDIGYAERMRWYETVGVIERAGGGQDLRAYFAELDVPHPFH